MTPQEYLTNVRRHLRVSAQQQEEILAELAEHCASLPDRHDIERHIGNPRLLAKSYNRIYLGWFHTPFRMYGIPIVVAAILYATNFITTFIVHYQSFAQIEQVSIVISLGFMLVWISVFTQLFKAARLMHRPRLHMATVLALLMVIVSLPELLSNLVAFQSIEMTGITATVVRVAVIATVSLLGAAVSLSIKKVKQRLD